MGIDFAEALSASAIDAPRAVDCDGKVAFVVRLLRFGNLVSAVGHRDAVDRGVVTDVSAKEVEVVEGERNTLRGGF